MKKIFDFVKGFLNFVKNNALLIFAAFFLLDFILGVFYIPTPVDPIERRIKYINLSIDLLWVFGFLEVYHTSKVEKYIAKRVDLVTKEVDFMYDTIRKAIEESEKEKKEEATKKEEKTVEQK